MDELIQAMSDQDLIDFKAKNPTNESLNTLIDGILAKRESDVVAVKLLDKFTKEVDKLIAKLPHPETVHNVYIRWAECEVTDEAAEAVEVEIVDEPAKLGDDGTTATPAVAHMESRKPTHKVHQWVVDLNKGFNVGTGNKATPTATKRGITLNKRNGNTLEFAGNFPSAAVGCKHLSIDKGSDSAVRVLQREGYIIDAYTGTDYTAS
ncbi:hypothetical protein LCGC14_1883390 [marine sediment metagenome]|uniref:Uncharacterized protein n=1 Tax=marine sediment metagenome TaxID=412755 RepID=A0A0F9G1N6_9ZZZZ